MASQHSMPSTASGPCSILHLKNLKKHGLVVWYMKPRLYTLTNIQPKTPSPRKVHLTSSAEHLSTPYAPLQHHTHLGKLQPQLGYTGELDAATGQADSSFSELPVPPLLGPVNEHGRANRGVGQPSAPSHTQAPSFRRGDWVTLSAARRLPQLPEARVPTTTTSLLLHSQHALRVRTGNTLLHSTLCFISFSSAGKQSHFLPSTLLAKHLQPSQPT